MTPTLTEIIAVVADRYGVDAASLVGPTRWRELVLPRHVAMYIMRETTGASLAGVGRAFGGRDHTTIMHAVNKVEANDALRLEAGDIEWAHGWGRGRS